MQNHYPNKIEVNSKTIPLPIYLPDATRAVAKSVDTIDLTNAHVKGLVVNTYHLHTTPGDEFLKNYGGINKFINFGGLVVSDSGGWQIFSLIHRSKLKGKITDEGVKFFNSKTVFSPEKSIQIQMNLGSDIVICLDDFTKPYSSYEQAKTSVDRTIKWAERCKAEYDKLTVNLAKKPLIFAVIQGDFFEDLRDFCYKELEKIGFDGYGFGGYPIDKITGKVDLKLSKFVCDLIDNTKYKFALGVGQPDDIVNLYKQGWQIFDCTLPTRDARHKRLYRFCNKNESFYEYLYINKEIYKSNNNPIEDGCDCHTCKNFTLSYLHHLFKINDTTAFRLATIHNLRFYTRLIENINKF